MTRTSREPPLSTRLLTARLVLRAPRPADVPEVRRVLRRNAEHLRPWSRRASPGEDPTSITSVSRSTLSERRDWRRGSAFTLLATMREPGEPIVGRLALFNVTRSAQQCAQLGYWIDRERQGLGLTTEAVRAVFDFAFGAAHLHRVQVNIMPQNVASLRVVEKLGLRQEGRAERLLEINGVWEDHLMFAVTAEEWPRPAAVGRP